MKNEKEAWIENVMRAVETMDSGSGPREAILNNILKTLDEPAVQKNVISFSQFKLAGIAAFILLALNIGIIGIVNIRSGNEVVSKSSYGLNTYTLDLYE